MIEAEESGDKQPAKVLDLMEALQASLDKAKTSPAKKAAADKKPAPAKKAPAKRGRTKATARRRPEACLAGPGFS